MLVENQLVEVKWNNYTKRWYEDRGYAFTHVGDSFHVHIKDLMPNSNAKVLVVCDYCNATYYKTYVEYNKNTNNGQQKVACAHCGRKKNLELQNYKTVYYEKFCELCKARGYIPISTLSDYTNAHTKLKFLCPSHGVQEITYASLYTGCGCNLCSIDKRSEIYRKSIDEVVKFVESKNNDKILNPEEYINSKMSNLRIICGSCKVEFVTSLGSIRNSDGACRKCAMDKTKNAQTLSPDDVEYRINSINGNILLNKNDYIKNNVRNLKIKCGKCGHIFTTSLSNYQTFNVTRCQSCTKHISKGEQMIIDILDKYDVNYIFQMKFDDCKDKRKLPYDFYFPEYNLCIEFDGPQHFEPKYGEEQFRITKLHDAMKDWYCRWNNIDLFRIPYWEAAHLEEILVAKLNLKINDVSQNLINAKSNSQSPKIKYIPNRKTA